MPIDKTALAAMLRRTALLWRENAGHLGDIDSRYGDGDHGVTMEKIANLILSRLDGWEAESMKSFIAGLADGIMAIGGGSAGPLYGTFVSGLAEPLADADAEIDGDGLKRMLAGALSSLREITKAQVGDKTMMDAVIPAVEAAADADGDDVRAILAAAADAANRGAEASKDRVAGFGRARSYGEKTIGTPDVGALSSALLFQGLSEGFSADLLA